MGGKITRLLVLAVLLVGAACTKEESGDQSGIPEKPDTSTTQTGPATQGSGQKTGPIFRETGFIDLPGWGKDNFSGAVRAFSRSCQKLLSRPDHLSIGPDGLAGRVADWQPACRSLAAVNPQDAASVKTYFERYFRVYSVHEGTGEQIREEAGEQEGAQTGTQTGPQTGPQTGAYGIFTGYYEPEMTGSFTPRGKTPTPLYGPPHDMISINLRDFRADLPAEKLIGRLEGDQLVPYHDRAAIDNGAIEDRSRKVIWLDDPIDAFFLHIQGSGKVILPDGRIVRVGYAGSNGQPFYGIGRALLEDGLIPRDKASMQSIRDWLRAHPNQATALMQRNKRFIFFRVSDGAGPYGAQGVVLTPTRSLAVDPSVLPLGAPIWLDTTFPGGSQELQRLMIAQDTGSAIKGVVRGDFFWGAGEEALAQAGRMKQQGRYWMLLPKTVTLDTQQLAENP